tara:strand:- start:229 stop:1782 length:1554 start_codon:yes stop_codon:yes gene_type:complete
MAKEVLELEVKSDIGEVVKQTEKLDKATEKGTKGFKGIGKAVKGIGTALKAAGIGLVVALLAKLMDVFRTNQKVVDAFETSMSALSIAFNDLFDFINNNIGSITQNFKAIFEDPQASIEAFGDMLQDNLIERFNSLVETFGFVGDALGKLFAGDFAGASESAKMAGKELVDVATGVDDSFDKIGETVVAATDAIVKYTKETISTASSITQLANAAQLAEVEYAKLNAQFLRDAELQRQIRDDVSLTFKERIQANKDLGDVLAEQAELQKTQVQIQIDAAQAQVDLNDTIENRVALGQAENAMLELKEAITGQISEQLTNQIGLEEELRQGIAQTQAEGMSGLERELQELKNAYDEKEKLAIKSGMKTTAITKKFEKDKTKLVQENANEQAEAFGNLAGTLSSLAGDNKALAVASAVIDTYVGANKAFAQGGVAGFVTGAAVIAGGLANVRTILAQDVPGSGGGGGGGAATTPAPQMMSGAFDLTGGVAPEPVKAFVVTDEMTNSQNQLSNIRRRATI